MRKSYKREARTVTKCSDEGVGRLRWSTVMTAARASQHSSPQQDHRKRQRRQRRRWTLRYKVRSGSCKCMGMQNAVQGSPSMRLTAKACGCRGEPEYQARNRCQHGQGKTGFRRMGVIVLEFLKDEMNKRLPELLAECRKLAQRERVRKKLESFNETSTGPIMWEFAEGEEVSEVMRYMPRLQGSQ